MCWYVWNVLHPFFGCVVGNQAHGRRCFCFCISGRWRSSFFVFSYGPNHPGRRYFSFGSCAAQPPLPVACDFPFVLELHQTNVAGRQPKPVLITPPIILVSIIMVTTIRNNVGSNLYRPFALGQRLFFVSLPTGPWPACYLLGMPLPCQICAVRFAFEAANGILPENRADAKDREKVKETKAIYAKRAAAAAFSTAPRRFYN